MTFVWSAQEHTELKSPYLKVSVNYGGGNATNNELSVDVPWGNDNSWPIGPGKNPQIQVDGEVAVCWGNSDPTTKRRPYYVIFSGRMVRPNANDIVSRDRSVKPPTPVPNNPVIVYASLV
jgi:hypothetical protein